MAYESPVDGGLDYFPCRYGKSKLLFRGPRQNLDRPFCVFLGGTETYGKFVADPYPKLVEKALGMPMVNLGCVNAGIDVFLKDAEILDIAGRARVTIVQVLGAQNMTNRFYAVHPRRNDRFLRAAPLLKTIFREVDFAEFHFTQHMLQTLHLVSPDKFEVVADELRAAWVARMKALLNQIPGDKVLLWISGHKPTTGGRMQADLWQDPLLVDAEMIAAVKPHATRYVEVVSAHAPRPQPAAGVATAAPSAPLADMVAGPAVHRDVAAAIAPVLREMI